jgi:hypothetical protein
MGTFKGTKGKWVIGSTPSGKVKIQDGYGFSIANMTSTIDQENRLNALLISKAPEMLEMLEKTERTLREVYECDTTEIKQLIKEATEL